MVVVYGGIYPWSSVGELSMERLEGGSVIFI